MPEAEGPTHAAAEDGNGLAGPLQTGHTDVSTTPDKAIDLEQMAIGFHSDSDVCAGVRRCPGSSGTGPVGGCGRRIRQSEWGALGFGLWDQALRGQGPWPLPGGQAVRRTTHPPPSGGAWGGLYSF